MPHGEFKTIGGKLVIADFDVEDGQLRNVAINGDFFLEPAEALEMINEALEGTPHDASTDEIAKRIRAALPGHVSMIGFSPESVAIAVRRGFE